jgi:hypothetical protein
LQSSATPETVSTVYLRENLELLDSFPTTLLNGAKLRKSSTNTASVSRSLHCAIPARTFSQTNKTPKAIAFVRRGATVEHSPAFQGGD